MKVRELLQTELWSKRASQKILVGIGIVFGLLIAWYLVERCVLTPGERAAARTALAQIDGMQNVNSFSDEDFSARDAQAQRQVEVVQQAGWTRRDKAIGSRLSAYLGLTEIDRESFKNMKELGQGHNSQSYSNEKLGEEIDSMGKKSRLMVRLSLHNAPD
jgi:hypothetical protein